MTAITTFVRKTPAASLRTYFNRIGIRLMPAVKWDAPEPNVVRPLLEAVEDLDDSAAARVVNDAERVTAMADEAGQAAIYSVAKAPDRLDELRNDHDRALWMFLNNPTGFRHAKEVRFTDDRRRGRMWDGFIGEPNQLLKRDMASVDAFKAAVCDRFQSNNVHVDIFDRHRPTFEGADCALVKALATIQTRSTLLPELTQFGWICLAPLNADHHPSAAAARVALYRIVNRCFCQKSCSTMPATIAMTNAITRGDRVARFSKAGPGHNPTRLHPIPNSIQPIIS